VIAALLAGALLATLGLQLLLTLAFAVVVRRRLEALRSQAIDHWKLITEN